MEKVKAIFTLGVYKLVQAIKAANIMKASLDLNKDGKTTLKEVIDAGKEVLAGKATIEFKRNK